MTASEVKAIVTIEAALDPAFFTPNILYIQETIIKGILTTDLYDSVIASPSSFTVLVPKIKQALAYAVAFFSYERDLLRNVSNQGIMENSTQFSKSSEKVNGVLSKIKQLEFDYCKALGEFLIDNAVDYPDFDIEKVSYEPNFRRFFPI
jgi:hypothetical protein